MQIKIKIKEKTRIKSLYRGLRKKINKKLKKENVIPALITAVKVKGSSTEGQIASAEMEVKDIRILTHETTVSTDNRIDNTQGEKTFKTATIRITTTTVQITLIRLIIKIHKGITKTTIIVAFNIDSTNLAIEIVQVIQLIQMTLIEVNIRIEVQVINIIFSKIAIIANTLGRIDKKPCFGFIY